MLMVKRSQWSKGGTKQFYKLVVLASGIAGGFKRLQLRSTLCFLRSAGNPHQHPLEETANDAHYRLMGGTKLDFLASKHHSRAKMTHEHSL